MKNTSAVRRAIMIQGERAYCRGFSQSVFIASQKLITPLQASKFIRAGEKEDWAHQADPVTGKTVTDYLPQRVMAVSFYVEVKKREGLESDISKLWEKRYRDGFRDGWVAFRRGEIDLYEATLYRHKASGNSYRIHTHPFTRERYSLRAVTLQVMSEIRDCNNLRQLF